MQTSDPKTENLNQLKDPQYMVHLTKYHRELTTQRHSPRKNSETAHPTKNRSQTEERQLILQKSPKQL